MKTLSIVRGVPGSGKSTLVAEMAESSRQVGLECTVCSADHFHMVNGEYRFDPRKIGEAHATCLAKAIQAMRDGIDLVIVDNTFIHRWEWMNYASIGYALGCRVQVVQVVPTEEQLAVCAARNVHGVPEEVIRRMAAEFELWPDGRTLSMAEGGTGNATA